MNDKAQQMQGFLKKAASVMAKTDAMSPIPKKHIPSLNESLAIERQMVGNFDVGDIGMYNEPTYESRPIQNYGQQSTLTESASKLPKDIFQSVMSNPIQEYNGDASGLSVLDSIMPPISRQEPIPAQNKRQVNEQYNYEEKEMPSIEDMFKNFKSNNRIQEQTNYQNNSQTSVNYDIINALIKNAISEEFRNLKVEMLKESKESGSDKLIVNIGSTVQFIDKNGNIFQGKLTKTGNIKDLR